MRSLLAALGLTACWLAAQTPVTVVSPRAATLNSNAKAPFASATETRMGAGIPVVGYVLGPEPTEIRAILGTAKKPQLSPKLAVPLGTSRIYLPPREHYLLIESSSDQPLALSNPSQAARAGLQLETIPISGAAPHPDLVAFSPRGEAAALYSVASKQLQVIGNLPAHASVMRQLSTASWSECRQIALTDDGELVIAGLSDGRLLYSSEGGRWAEWSAGYTPGAWSFVPNSHDLVLSDPAQRAIVLLSKLNEKPETHILTLQVQADRLGVTKDGEQLVAADSGSGRLWTIELKTGALTALTPANVESLDCLRDGYTFLLSPSPTLSLLKLTAPAGVAAQLRR